MQADTNDNGEELQSHPLLEVAGMFAIGEPGWADKHDEYLAETYYSSRLCPKP
jgi:hypothetical protein